MGNPDRNPHTAKAELTPMMQRVIENSKHHAELKETEAGLLISPEVADPMLEARCLMEAVKCGFEPGDNIVVRFKDGHVESGEFVRSNGPLLIIKVRGDTADIEDDPNWNRCFIDQIDLSAVYEG